MTPALLPHLQVRRYGPFTLTDAVRPGLAVPIAPRAGYRQERYRDPATGRRGKLLTAAVSAEAVFDAFLDLLALLEGDCTAVLESSHGDPAGEHRDYRRTDIDAPVLASVCCDFEELITHDGCTGVAALAPDSGIEVQLDEHKQILVYAPELRPFRAALRRHGLREVEGLRLLSEAEHYHQSPPGRLDEFRQLAMRLGVAEFDRVLADEAE